MINPTNQHRDRKMESQKQGRKKLSTLCWCVRWQGGTLEVFALKRLALYEMEFHSYNKASLFHCRIEEVTK